MNKLNKTAQRFNHSLGTEPPNSQSLFTLDTPLSEKLIAIFKRVKADISKDEGAVLVCKDFTARRNRRAGDFLDVKTALLEATDFLVLIKPKEVSPYVTGVLKFYEIKGILFDRTEIPWILFLCTNFTFDIDRILPLGDALGAKREDWCAVLDIFYKCPVEDDPCYHFDFSRSNAERSLAVLKRLYLLTGSEVELNNDTDLLARIIMAHELNMQYSMNLLPETMKQEYAERYLSYRELCELLELDVIFYEKLKQNQ